MAQAVDAIRPPSSSELVIGPGEPIESQRHLRQMMRLLDSLEFAWRDRSDYLVGGGTWFYFSATQAKSTEHVDRGGKMRIYARQLRVGEYFLFDPYTRVLEGYELDLSSRAYRRKAADAQGNLRSEQMELSLGRVPGTYHGIEMPWLRWIGADGTPLPLPSERADAEAERVRRLEAELAALKAQR